MARLDTNAYYALGVPLYVGLAALEWAIARRRGERPFRPAVAIGNVSAGVGEVVLGLFLGPLYLAAYDLGFRALPHPTWPAGSLVPWLLAFVGADLCYYLYHRASHGVAILWAIHGVHHQSDAFDVTVAMRHPWLSDTYAVLFYAPMPLLGVPPTQFFVAVSAISFYALTYHSARFARPSLGLLVTPTTHVVHHAVNRRYLGRNLGALFTVWDRLFGTHVEVTADDPPRLGNPFGYETHDGARAQWVLAARLLGAARAAPRLVDKLRILVGRPGWLPPGQSWTPLAEARADEAIPPAVRRYAALALVETIAFAGWILWFRDRHPRWLLGAGAAALLLAITTLGGLLDGRAGARRADGARLAAWAILGGAMLLVPGERAAGLAVVAAASSSALLLAGTVRPAGEPDLRH